MGYVELCSEHACGIAQAMLRAMHATYATYATDERVQDLGENPRVPDASNPVDNREEVHLAVAS